MTEDEQRRQKKHKRLWLALAVLVAILAVLIVPPLVSVSRYTSRITSLIAESLGRPVRLSSVRVRLLPRPGFVLGDLTVEEDPAFGAEPLLHATTVTAYIRMLSLWRGRLEISEGLYQGTALAVTKDARKVWASAPAGAVAKAFGYRCGAARPKPCPDTKPAAEFPLPCLTPGAGQRPPHGQLETPLRLVHDGHGLCEYSWLHL